MLSYRKNYQAPFFLILSLSLLAAGIGLGGPLLQKLFVDRLLGIEDDKMLQLEFLRTLNELSPPWLVVGAFLSTIAATGLTLAAAWLGLKESIRAQAWLAEQIYHKTLRLRADQMGGRTVGEVVSLYATDVPGATALLDQTLPGAAGIIFPLLLAPIVINWIADVPLWTTVLLMAAIVLLNAVLAYRQARFFRNFKQLAAERTGLVAEWIQNIRLLKILGWIESYEKKIYQKRVEETDNRVVMLANGQMMGAIGSSMSFFINLSGVASIVLIRQGDVTPGELLALLWIFGVFLARPFRQTPWMLTWGLDALTSLRRLEKFLSSEEGSVGPAGVHVVSASTAREESLALRVRGLNLEIGGVALLHSIDLDLFKGEFVAAVGEVGSGKSLFLLSLMGETGAVFQEYQVGGRDVRTMTERELRSAFSYVPQEGFVMSATLRENVAFAYGESQMNDAKLRTSLQAAEFDLGREGITNGLETDIGERGVNLSGGQRQRVSLARADQNARSIYLLDDCLSAVDVETERKLIQNLFDRDWKKSTRLLVTHRLSVLEHVDRILFFQGGRLLTQGTLAELQASSAEFRQFTATIALQKKEAPPSHTQLGFDGGGDGEI